MEYVSKSEGGNASIIFIITSDSLKQETKKKNYHISKMNCIFYQLPLIKFEAVNLCETQYNGERGSGI